ncbi:unnamed protein product, partial [Phaeothamnion confervicola]
SSITTPSRSTRVCTPPAGAFFFGVPCFLRADRSGGHHHDSGVGRVEDRPNDQLSTDRPNPCRRQEFQVGRHGLSLVCFTKTTYWLRGGGGGGGSGDGGDGGGGDGSDGGDGGLQAIVAAERQVAGVGLFSAATAFAVRQLGRYAGEAKQKDR